MPSPEILYAKDVVTVAGAVGSFIVFSIGVSTYYRTEKWKRAEFLANEMKEFFATPRVQKALILIDWGYRRIDLIENAPPGKGSVVVTRAMQASGLRPHILLTPNGSDIEMAVDDESEHKTSFTHAEAAIRDAYDALLDGFERLASYVKTGLVEVASLRPYIGYWVDDIASPTDNSEDAAWCAALLTYISFYRYDGVLWLFDAFGKSIRPSAPIYSTLLAAMQDQDFASELARTVGCTYDRKSA
jgi:hypothetical protein